MRPHCSPLEFVAQVLRYEHMEHYSAHHDYFDPAAYQSNRGMLESVEHGARNRLMTVFFYLTNISKGTQPPPNLKSSWTSLNTESPLSTLGLAPSRSKYMSPQTDSAQPRSRIQCQEPDFVR